MLARHAALLLTLSGVLVSQVASSGGLDGAVTVAKKPVPENVTEAALDDCRRHAAELSPATCLDRYFVPRWLMDRDAEKKELNASPVLEHHLKDVLHQSLIQQITKQVKAPSASEIDEYLKKHARDFEQPLRLRLFRILLADEKSAREVLSQLGPRSLRLYQQS